MINFKQLLYHSTPHHIFVSAWLEEQGIDRKSTYAYKKNNWITSLGYGAFVKKDVSPMLDAAVEALQKQLLLPLHFGGKSALLNLHRRMHFVKFKKERSELFAPTKTVLPTWFKSNFQEEYDLVLSDFLPDTLGIEERETEEFKLNISSPERAFLEMLFRMPSKTSTKEAYQILELLPTLRPKLLNTLLSQCKSIKVNRLFLYLADEANLDWLVGIEKDKINIGSGIRSIDKAGTYNKKYRLVINQVGDI